ncbi:cytochrome P450 [Suillus subaureus]|uniref:Cytochrome P450 n=1 Tax=Suillus subaureus TaxID=48587 RepID=A0A9P7E7T1_9AGAM|nr:cytochrome P450 [Suillus subaureus]XP_041191401.1 cytochrome P450 [Suillus subaureus]KAG1800179.1 cytochrome P450 [Suillus subaureus]KAG1813640.1 cytochrome P450 [Suillus subaureus]
MLTIPNVTWLDLLCLTGVGVYLVKQVIIKKNPAPYPPGPRGWPLIGNILDMPRIKPWVAFTEWGQKYGDIAHIEVLGRHIIVLNSTKTALEMMDSKSTLYSDRPVLPMAGELVGWKDSLPFLPYGNRFRQQRKNFHRIIGSRAAVDVYNVVEEVETRRFLKRVLAKPDQLQEHVRHTAGAIILRISHGYEVKENNDPFVDLADRVIINGSQAASPGAYMVDTLPFLAKVPVWFPGAGFKRIARKWRETLEEMVSAPHKLVKDQMAAGTAPVSLTSNLLEGRDVSAEEEHSVKWSAFSLYSGGADTTVSAINSFFLAMTLFPDVQKKAQAEIDAVVGSDRLPTFADRDSLPYTEVLVKEVLRWNVVVPTGFPHRVTEDDIHNGYYIPKGSIVLPNIWLVLPFGWFMLKDPRTYTNPSQFNPDRFLAKDGKDPETEPRTACFGFGRRICPGVFNSHQLIHSILTFACFWCTGIHLAEASIWISTVMSLAVFDISKVVENGIEITPSVEPSPGTISHPKPFKCSIKPRSATALRLIEQDANY